MSKNTDLAGYDTSLPVANLTATGTLSIGSNVIVNTSTVFVGNSTVNTIHNSSSIAVGANIIVNTTIVFIGNSTVSLSANSSTLILSNTTGIYANGSLGTANQVLTSNGSTVYWATSTGGTLTTYYANVGNAAASSFTITHNLNSNYLITTVRENSTGYIVYPDIQQTSTNALSVSFVDNPTANQYIVLVSKVA